MLVVVLVYGEDGGHKDELEWLNGAVDLIVHERQEQSE